MSHSLTIVYEQKLTISSFFIEEQNQPLVAAMNNMQVDGKTSDEGASGKSF
jgi:hypothetical protein